MTDFNTVPRVEKDTPALWKLKKKKEKNFFKLRIWQINLHILYTDRSPKIKPQEYKNSICDPMKVTCDTRLLSPHIQHRYAERISLEIQYNQ